MSNSKKNRNNAPKEEKLNSTSVPDHLEQFDFVWNHDKWVFPLVRETVTELAHIMNAELDAATNQFEPPYNVYRPWNILRLYENAESCRKHKDDQFYRYWLDRIINDVSLMIWNNTQRNEYQRLTDTGQARNIERDSERVADIAFKNFLEKYK